MADARVLEARGEILGGSSPLARIPGPQASGAAAVFSMMRGVNLIIVEPSEVRDSGEVRLSGPRAIHLLDVLKVTPGRSVRVGILDGPTGMATVSSTGSGEVSLVCLFDSEAPLRPRVDLLLAVPRPKVMRRLWAQLAALGVGRIILTNAEKVERPYFDTHLLAPESYRPLLVEGLQQARDTMLPVVSIHRRFKVLIEDDLDHLTGVGLRLAADPFATLPVREAVGPGQSADAAARVLLAVGPEGGWNDFELELLAAHGFQRVGLGPRTLRTDTACLALLTLVHDALS